MAVATLYDVHGNIRALEAVLAEIPEDVTIVVGGDVAAGPYPAETLERLRALGGRARWLRGNADRELTPGEEGLAPAQAMAWLRARLSEEQIAFLHGLPPGLSLDGVLYCHATPRNDVDIFTGRTPEERLTEIFAGVAEDVVVCGHTHTQFERTIAGKRVVNAGSVGMAYEDEPGAYWLLDLEPRRTPYVLDTGEWPLEWPSASREEAVAHFERIGLGA